MYFLADRLAGLANQGLMDSQHQRFDERIQVSVRSIGIVIVGWDRRSSVRFFGSVRCCASFHWFLRIFCSPKWRLVLVRKRRTFGHSWPRASVSFLGYYVHLFEEFS